jgi:hypothetical protein
MPSAYNAQSATGPGTNIIDAGAGNVFRNITLKVTGPATDSVVNLETSPDGTTWTVQDAVTGPNWGYTALHHSRRAIRANVTNLGTGGLPLATVVTATV